MLLQEPPSAQEGPGRSFYARPDAASLRERGLKRLRVAAPTYCAGIFLIGLWAAFGLSDWHDTLAISALIVGTYLLYYLLLRSGWSMRFADPMLTFPQVLTNIGNVAIVYALLEDARAASLLWLSLIIVFDIRRLAVRQMVITAVLAMVLPAFLLVLMAPLERTVASEDQLVFLLWGAFQVPVLLLVGRQSRRVRTRLHNLRAELGQAVEEMRHLSRTDGLTQLTNRTHMQQLLDDEERRHARTQADYRVALLDIDHFKHVNDTYGHAVGDAVLQRFAALMRASFDGGPDVVARWGGEEFLILMPESTRASASSALLRLQAAVHGYDWERIRPGLHVTFSAGAAARSDVRRADELITHADDALYRAKRNGRDRIEPKLCAAAAEAGACDQPAHTVALQALIAKADQLVTAERPPVIPAHRASASGLASAATPPAHARRARPSLLFNLLLGRDEAMRGTVASVLAGASVYLVMLAAIQLHGMPMGLMPPDVGRLLSASCALAAVVPYLLVRAGLTRGWQDRSLTVPQMLWALCNITVGFVAAPASRANTLQIVCLVLIFGFINLRPRQAVAVGAIACLAPLVGVVVIFAGGYPHGTVAHEVLQVLSSVLVFALVSVISRNLGVLREVAREERRKLADTAKQINDLVMRDGLTGLYNRAHAIQLLQAELDRTERSGRAFSVALIDLDHFKKINDTHGHAVGDEVLRQFGKHAVEAMRTIDVVARWGGEEFLVMLPEVADRADAMLAVDRLRVRIGDEALSASRASLRATLSAGVATLQQGEDIAHLLERADRALYMAKEQGRNRCTYSDPPLLRKEAAAESRCYFPASAALTLNP